MSPPGGSSPEQFARQEIDKLLTKAAWIVQNRDEINLDALARQTAVDRAQGGLFLTEQEHNVAAKTHVAPRLEREERAT